MTLLLTGTVDHGVRGDRGVGDSHGCSYIPGTLRYSPELTGSGSHYNGSNQYLEVCLPLEPTKMCLKV